MPVNFQKVALREMKIVEDTKVLPEGSIVQFYYDTAPYGEVCIAIRMDFIPDPPINIHQYLVILTGRYTGDLINISGEGQWSGIDLSDLVELAAVSSEDVGPLVATRGLNSARSALISGRLQPDTDRALFIRGRIDGGAHGFICVHPGGNATLGSHYLDVVDQLVVGALDVSCFGTAQ